MQASFFKHVLNFSFEAGTSRGVLTKKTSYYLILEKNGKKGIGEVSIIPNLSIDANENILENKLTQLTRALIEEESINDSFFVGFPSLKFAFETAQLSLNNNNPFQLFPNTSFIKDEKPIAINGLIWMGKDNFQLKQIEEKLTQGFNCLKLKIGALDFNQELAILKSIRERFSEKELEIRVDANGAFKFSNALTKLNQLAHFKLHSIEQPIKQGQWQKMKTLCLSTPIPIALDEELIGIYGGEKAELINIINPQYIILKPSLIGGYKASEEWIEVANSKNIGWWATSALESNVGLNAIAQWTASQNVNLPQGLGTGGLYTNNIDSPLEVKSGNIYYRKNRSWALNFFLSKGFDLTQ